MRHRGHGDRGQKETGGEVSMAMRCVSEACGCNVRLLSDWLLCDIVLRSRDVETDVDILRNTHFKQGSTLKSTFLSSEGLKRSNICIYRLHSSQIYAV